MSFFRIDDRWYDEAKAVERAQGALGMLADEVDGLLYARGFKRLGPYSWLDEQTMCIIYLEVTTTKRLPFHTRFYNERSPPPDG